MTPKEFRSPWLAQLRQERPHFQLEKDTSCDVAVVGAGIAGVSTAYFLLKKTNKKVLLVEAGRIAHGATGHNAGQVVSYFERPLNEIAKEFGIPMAVRAQMEVESAWGLLEDILKDCKLTTPLYTFMGNVGFSTIEQVIIYLEQQQLRKEAAVFEERLMMKVDPALLAQIPEHLQRYVMSVPHSLVLRTLETDDHMFIAAAPTKRGCMNSALFCEELVAWMVAAYPERFMIAEHLPVKKVVLRADEAMLETDGPRVEAKKVVLCTNGFENFEIVNEAGPDIDVSFHDHVEGQIGYMAGYLDDSAKGANALVYYRQQRFDEPYYYLTRRPYEHSKGESKTLLCIGGPERELPNGAEYDRSLPFPGDVDEELDRELRALYPDTPPVATRTFLWHGLMGYTPNRIRRIGFEPLNKTLLYNLGCNGIGIMPSIFGGKRIAQLIAGMRFPPSIFDPEMGDR